MTIATTIKQYNNIKYLSVSSVSINFDTYITTDVIGCTDGPIFCIFNAKIILLFLINKLKI